MKGIGGRIGLSAGVVLLLVAAWLSPRAIPYNMDEFVHYHALGCATAELSRHLPLIRDGCGYYDLSLPFTFRPLPLRSYAYIGSLPSLPFYPLWRVVRDPVAARLQGAIFFLLWLWLATRLLRVRPVGSARNYRRPGSIAAGRRAPMTISIRRFAERSFFEIGAYWPNASAASRAGSSFATSWK